MSHLKIQGDGVQFQKQNKIIKQPYTTNYGPICILLWIMINNDII